MKRPVSLTGSKAVALQYVDGHQYLPDYIKPLVKSQIVRHFQVMSQMIGNAELIVGRTQHAMRDERRKKRPQDGPSKSRTRRQPRR